MSLLSNFLKTAGIFDEMDALARAQFLEGFTGAQPFAKIRGATGKSQLLGIIAKLLAEVGGTSEEWTSKGDTGLYRRAFMTVNKAIRSQGSATEAADLMQSLMGLAGWQNEEGETVGGKPVFWSVGKYAAQKNSQWLAKGMVPTDAAGLAIKFAFRRALDVIKSEETRAKYHDLAMGESPLDTSPESEDNDPWSAVIDGLFSNPDNPLAKKFFDWLYGKLPQIMIRAKRGERIKQYLDLLRSGQRGLTDSESAAAIGATLSQFSGAKIEFMKVLEEYISSHPDEQQKILSIFSSSPALLRSLVTPSFQRAASQRVASRFFAQVRKAARREAHFDLADQVATIYVSRQAGKNLLDIRDPQTNQTYDEMKAEYDGKQKVLYEKSRDQSVTWQERDLALRQSGALQKEMAARLERLRQRVEKAKRGLRLSTNSKYMATLPQRGEWGTMGRSKPTSLGSNQVPAAILRGDEVVGWMIETTTETHVMSKDGYNYSVGRTMERRFEAYQLDGKALPNNFPSQSRRSTDALDQFAKFLQSVAPVS